MKKLVVLIFVFGTITFGEDLSSLVDDRFAVRLDLQNISSKTIFTTNDSSEVGSSPIFPMFASLILPGFGQYLNFSPWWKTALFSGIEVAGIVGYFAWTNKADDITKEYEEWADEHWNIKRWVNDSSILLSDIVSKGYAEVNDVKIDGSHDITIIVNGKYESSHILLANPNLEYTEIRDFDFYEGIGKYDQFVAGWDDAKTDWEIIQKKIADGEDELIVMTPNKQHYLELRDDSNKFYTRAKFAATALLINHIVSALDALLFTNKNSELSLRLDVSPELKSDYVIRGISVQWGF